MIRSIKNTSEKVATQAKTQDQLLESNEFSKTIYKMIIQRKISIPRKSEQKWERVCLEQDNMNINWEKTYLLAFQATKNSKLRTFQFKLLHRKIATNDFLSKIGISPNNLCSTSGVASPLEWIETYMYLTQSFGCVHNVWQRKGEGAGEIEGE